MSDRFLRLDRLKEQLDQHQPLPHAVVHNLHESLVLQWTYHSNAIEGNTLTLKETKVALEGITVGGKTLREHFEVINHREAIWMVEDWVKQREPLSEWLIKSLHQLVLKNVDDQNAGAYRQVNVMISGAEHRPPEAYRVPQAMSDFLHWYHQEAGTLHPIERAARLHGEFVKVHPFVDGNGRTSRLLMNFELMKAGFPAALIKVEQRLAYYEALDTAHCTGNYDLFVDLLCDSVENSFEPYWWALGINRQPDSK